MKKFLMASLVIAVPGVASAQNSTPKIVADIGPVHALVQQVLGDIAQAELLLEGQFDIHDFAFKPSQAARLQDADVFFWVGADLSPWMAGPLNALAPNSQSIELIESDRIDVLTRREFKVNGHDDHDHDHSDHGHGNIDAHAWLDPAIAVAWVDDIAQALSVKMPDHREAIAMNAVQTKQEIAAKEQNIRVQFDGLEDLEFIVLHDALRYFENAFNLSVKGVVSTGGSHAHSPQAIRALQTVLADQQIDCALIEKGESKNAIARLFPGSSIAVVEVSLFGNATTTSPIRYADFLQDIADNFLECAK